MRRRREEHDPFDRSDYLFEHQAGESFGEWADRDHRTHERREEARREEERAEEIAAERRAEERAAQARFEQQAQEEAWAAEREPEAAPGDSEAGR